MAIQIRAWIRSIIGVGLVTQVAVASATLITETHTFSSNPADVAFSVSNVDGSVSANIDPPTSDPETLLPFGLFDPALGTLNSATIAFTSSFNATATLISATNSGSDPASVTFFSDGVLTIELTSAKFSTQALTPDPSVSDSCAAISGETCKGLGHMISGNFDSPTLLAGGIGPLSTASFMGPGSFDVTATLSSALTPRVDPDNGSGFADNATFSGLLSSLWSGSVTVQYDYTANATSVPEPLTLYLLLAGLGGIALARRRRS